MPVDDDALEPHHGLLDVDADGAVRFVQLTGRVTGRIGGEPIGAPVAVPDDAVLVLGASRLRVGRAVRPTDGRRGAHDPRRAIRGAARCGGRPGPARAGSRPPIPVPAPAGPACGPGAIGSASPPP